MAGGGARGGMLGSLEDVGTELVVEEEAVSEG